MGKGSGSGSAARTMSYQTVLDTGFVSRDGWGYQQSAPVVIGDYSRLLSRIGCLHEDVFRASQMRILGDDCATTH
jgi:hypothetical protein